MSDITDPGYGYEAGVWMRRFEESQLALATLQREVEALKDKSKAHKSELVEMHEQRRTLTVEVESLRKSESCFISERREINKLNTALKSEVESLRGELATCKMERDNTFGAFGSANLQIDSLRRERDQALTERLMWHKECESVVEAHNRCITALQKAKVALKSCRWECAAKEWDKIEAALAAIEECL